MSRECFRKTERLAVFIGVSGGCAGATGERPPAPPFAALAVKATRSAAASLASTAARVDGVLLHILLAALHQKDMEATCHAAETQ
jgi:hypothetical protein